MLKLVPLAYPCDIEGWTPDARRLLVGVLLAAARGEIRGQKLDKRPGMADLSDCRKLYLLNTTVRIVYRVIRGEMHVIAIGERYENVVYELAGARLNRPPLPMHYFAEPEAA